MTPERECTKPVANLVENQAFGAVAAPFQNDGATTQQAHDASFMNPPGIGGILRSAMKVLVVEDNKKLARFLQKAFEEEGYSVDVIEDGSEALEKIPNSSYDLIILDWMLPGTDGVTVCRTLRSNGVVTPVLILTARAEVTERITGLDAGADDYLSKPFDLGELLARVRALGRRGSTGEAVLKVGPLVLDRLERHATLNGQPIDLTPREFTLIAYLARESGRVVPRSELLRKVWETTYDPGSNVVDAHIKKLREKLNEHSTLIETVRGVGYRIVATDNQPRA
jgi:two-component system OmpR family response regulator